MPPGAAPAYPEPVPPVMGRLEAKEEIPIVEEWTAWFLVRERERELARQQRVREAEETRAKSPRAKLVTLPARPTERERPPRGRRAA